MEKLEDAMVVVAKPSKGKRQLAHGSIFWLVSCGYCHTCCAPMVRYILLSSCNATKNG